MVVQLLHDLTIKRYYYKLLQYPQLKNVYKDCFESINGADTHLQHNIIFISCVIIWLDL